MFPLNFGRDDEDYQIALGNNGQVTSEIFIFFFVWKIILEFGKEREDPRYNSAWVFAWAEIGGFRDYIESKGDLTESKRWQPGFLLNNNSPSR